MWVNIPIVPWILWISSNKRHTASPMFYTTPQRKSFVFYVGCFQRCFAGAASILEKPRSATLHQLPPTRQLARFCASWRWKSVANSTYHTCHQKENPRSRKPIGGIWWLHPDWLKMDTPPETRNDNEWKNIQW